MPSVAHAHSTSCANCGLPGAKFEARVRQRPENRFRRETFRTVMFCNQECAVQAAFLRLEAHITRETVTRFYAGHPIRYAEFRLVGLHQVGKTSTHQNAAERQQTVF